MVCLRVIFVVMLLGAVSLQPQTPHNSRNIFHAESMGELDPGYGILLGYTTFSAPDGNKVRVLYLMHRSSKDALEAFNQELKRAAKIVNLGDKKDRKGAVLGKRAEILVPTNKLRSSVPAVIWTSQDAFYEITSDSLRDVLKLEEVY